MSLPWYTVVGNPEGITLDPSCTSLDKCAMILSTKAPSKRYHNFWPLPYNTWPSDQVVTISAIIIQLCQKRQYVLYFAIFPHAQVYVVLELGQLVIQYRSLDSNGEWDVIKELTYPMGSQQTAAPSFSIEVSAFDAGIREVLIRVMDESGIYQSAADGSLDIPTSEDLAEGAYYIAFLHEKFNASFVTTGTAAPVISTSKLSTPTPAEI